MRHIISVLLENESGSLSRVSGLFSARGYNIESLTVAPTNDETLSRMTIVTNGDDRKIDQIEKQLFKLVDVAALQDITVNQHLEREVVLVKVSIGSENGDQQSAKEELDRVADAFNASLIDVSDQVFILELAGSSQKVDELLKALANLQIIEVARSGATGLTSSEKPLTVPPTSAG
ncbi:MAG: acetolactate synthase small subunit [Pseudomonadota bacterium]